jgi:sortase A
MGQLKPSKSLSVAERIAVLLASFIWTLVVSAGVVLLYFNWSGGNNHPSHTGSHASSHNLTMLAPPQPSLLLPPAAPTPPPPPTPTATRVVALPEMLPEFEAPPGSEPFTLPLPTATPEPQPATQSTTAPIPGNVLPPPPTLAPARQAAIPSRVVIETANVNAEVIPVGWHTVEANGQFRSVWQVADYAVGWHMNSGLPGEVDNIVLVGHSNSGGEVFRHLDKVKRGDTITVTSGDQSFVYEVSLTTIVKEAGESPEVRRENTRWIASTAEERLTLVTCWPYPNNTHRLIVVARPVKVN